MTFSPFYMGNDTQPQGDEGYVITENWGFQINFAVPLDKRGLEQCRQIAKRQEEKMRLDYELVRALKCAELMQKGFTIRPQTRVAHMCQDIVPIQSLLPKDVSTTKTNRINFLKGDKFKTFVIDLLEKLSKESDNDLDDKAVEFIKRGLKVE